MIGHRNSVFLLVICLTIFATPIPSNGTIFGRDDRETINIVEQPWTAIGLLSSQKTENDPYSIVCTATLIAKNLILTAGDKHCVEASSKNQIYYFYPYSGSTMYTTENAAKAVLIGSGHRNAGGDWAILEVPVSIGTKFGFLPIEKFDFRQHFPMMSGSGIFTSTFFKNLKISLPEYFVAGMDFEETYVLKVHKNCHLVGIDSIFYGLLGQQRVKNYCDLIPGNSGGPLVMKINGQWRVIGINSSQSNMGLSLGFGNPDRNWLPIDPNSMNTIVGIFSFFDSLISIVLKHGKE